MQHTKFQMYLTILFFQKENNINSYHLFEIVKYVLLCDWLILIGGNLRALRSQCWSFVRCVDKRKITHAQLETIWVSMSFPLFAAFPICQLVLVLKSPDDPKPLWRKIGLAASIGNQFYRTLFNSFNGKNPYSSIRNWVRLAIARWTRDCIVDDRFTHRFGSTKLRTLLQFYEFAVWIIRLNTRKKYATFCISLQSKFKTFGVLARLGIHFQR